MITISEWQGQIREELSEGSRMQIFELMMRRMLKVSWHKTTKPCDLTATVNDAAVHNI
jgi:hypothetical protein